MVGYVVYVDQVFFGNLLMNYLILWSAGRLSNARSSFLRLALAAGLGSFYSLLAFLPGTGLLFGFPGKLLFSLLMVLAAFAPLSWRTLVACAGFFYLSSFALGGMVLGFTYLLHSNAGFFREMKEIPAVISHHFWSGVLLSLLFGWTAYRLGHRLLERRLTRRRFKIAISFFGRQVEVDALVDTGNSLVDPLSGDPVIVVEYEALKAVLPPKIRKSLEEKHDYTRLLAELANTPWAARLRVIPFQSLGQQHGLMAGLRPDAVEIDQGSKKITAEKVIVGIYHHRLHSGENYQALLHPALLEAA